MRSWGCLFPAHTRAAYSSNFPSLWRKALSLVLILGPGPGSHSSWARVWGLLSFHSSCHSSLGREDKMTNLGREMEGRRELTCGLESAGFILPHFLIARGCCLFRESCSADRGSFHHRLIIPLSDLAEKEGNSLSFQFLAFVLRLLKSFASRKLEIIPFDLWSAKIPNGLSFLLPVVLFCCPLQLCILSVIKLSLSASCMMWMWACFTCLPLPSACAGSCRW